MSSVNEILAKLNIRRKDLNNLSTTQLETIFSNLTSKEISLLCRVNRKFNTLCKYESYWKNRVRNRHGIRKMYGDTWRETAKIMDEFNMINMDTVWLDGRTYWEILDDALENGHNILEGLQVKYLLPYVNDNKEDAEHLRGDIRGDKEEIQFFGKNVNGKLYTDDELDNISLINSWDLDVIYTAVLIYGPLNVGVYEFLPGGGIDTASQSYESLRKMIDPILYVMQFSSVSPSGLEILL
uniref:F-box-like family protein n=1 Tax=Pithovirus LCPAC406 TaxID=2506599 RepID=A0A481ZD49_9VIRU|nr:MAG: F-box-like family protein [Pithovirus LCPAC406]